MSLVCKNNTLTSGTYVEVRKRCTDSKMTHLYQFQCESFILQMEGKKSCPDVLLCFLIIFYSIQKWLTTTMEFSATPSSSARKISKKHHNVHGNKRSRTHQAAHRDTLDHNQGSQKKWKSKLQKTICVKNCLLLLSSVRMKLLSCSSQPSC